MQVVVVFVAKLITHTHTHTSNVRRMGAMAMEMGVFRVLWQSWEFKCPQNTPQRRGPHQISPFFASIRVVPWRRPIFHCLIKTITCVTMLALVGSFSCWWWWWGSSTLAHSVSHCCWVSISTCFSCVFFPPKMWKWVCLMLILVCLFYHGNPRMRMTRVTLM